MKRYNKFERSSNFKSTKGIVKKKKKIKREKYLEKIPGMIDTFIGPLCRFTERIYTYIRVYMNINVYVYIYTKKAPRCAVESMKERPNRKGRIKKHRVKSS